MKNHIIFKFIAILLCAVSLLGALGSAAGILVLTQGDLYNKTVDQFLEEKIQTDGQQYAHTIAWKYASRTLGGCPEIMVENHSDDYWFHSSYNSGAYGYRLLDAEGNVLESLNEGIREEGTTHTFSASGQYMHLTSLMTESEKYPPVVVEENNGETFVYNAVPEGGVVAQGFSVTYGDSESEGITAPDGIGMLYYNSEGNIQFDSFEPLEVADSGGPITHIVFHDENGMPIYEAYAPDSVGFFNYFGDGRVTFYSRISEQRIGTPVYTAIFAGGGEETFYYELSSDSGPVGYFRIDEAGYAVFETDIGSLTSWREEGRLDTGYVQAISLLGASGAVICDLTLGGENVGFVYYDRDQNFTFISSQTFPTPQAKAVEETIPLLTEVPSETTPVTSVPEEIPVETIVPTEVPAETAAEETKAAEEPQAPEETAVPEETAIPETMEETVPSSASAVPEEEQPAQETVDAVIEETTVVETTAEVIPIEELQMEPSPNDMPTLTFSIDPIPMETIEVNIEHTMPVLIDGKSIEEFDILRTQYYDGSQGETMYAEYVYTLMPEYTVELYLTEDVLRYESVYTLLRVAHYFRNDLFLVLGVSLLMFAIFAVYLCCAAGRKPKTEEIKPAGLNVLPLDLYVSALIFGEMGIIALGMYGTDYFLRQKSLEAGVVFALFAGFFGCLLLVGFCFAFVAQVKTPGGYWWRNTLTGRFFRLFIRFGVWLEQFLSLKFFPWLGRTLKTLWKATCKTVLWLFHMWEIFANWTSKTLKRVFSWMGAKLHRFFSLLPLTWQWMIAGFSAVFLLFITLAERYDAGIILSVLYALALILYASHCFGILSESTRRMSKGDLDTKVEDKLLIGCFKDFADDLNDLADVAVVAAQKQLKSERMKTELITNVSHDIKTPLTSIINYVDLLQKAKTEEEREQYLEVLNRQSQRLKKLIEDLMDMSKASTGNMTVDITTVDAVESVNQALGEFSDKLDRAQLIPVFRHTEDSVAMMADGRLVWRVMSNLLTNAVKYAMPGTRLYIDLMQLEGKVVISLKNISRDELNVDADELMERFVRGDDSRNTEGSGLGLNIAKSLMELQKGQLQLLVDGDLFKVTLIFPGA